jgi:chemotaxis methyl-accepting protein methylase
LTRIANLRSEAAPDPSAIDEACLVDIIAQVERSEGISLRDYRRTTIARRVATRLKMAGCRDCSEYLSLLSRSPEEAKRLVEHVTINWSRFFRDERVFTRLRDEVLPDLAARTTGDLSIWSAGCARGEEPYSLAILFREMAAAGRNIQATIRGTDIDEAALEAARRRVYPRSALEEAASHLVDSYFTPQQGRLALSYRLHDDVGESVHFARHDLLSGKVHPDGCSFHLVLCRNVLIYFEHRVHERVLDLLVSSLTPGGYLCLGETEQLPASHARYFEIVDRRDRFFRKR